MTPDLVVLGNLLLDDVVFPDGRTRMGEPGGAALYAALGASLWGARVGLCTKRGDDYPGQTLDTLQVRGVDLGGIRRLDGPSLRTWLLYEGRRRRVVHRLEGPTHEAASPTAADLPAGWEGARAFHVAPMPFEVQQGLVEAAAPRSDALVSLDPYLLLRPDTLSAWRTLIGSVDVFLLSEDDLELTGAEKETLRGLAGDRTRFIATKRGARGGLLCDVRADRWHEWPARAERVVDPTGSGDAFAAGFMAGLLAGDTPTKALGRAVVSASFALEDWGPAGLLAATPAQAEARLASWFG